MDVPGLCQRQEPIITTDQKTVEVPQIQSEDLCRRVTSCSADCAVRVLMGVRRAWRMQPVDDCSWAVLTNPLGPESTSRQSCLRSSLTTSPDVSQVNRHSVMSTRKGVNPPSKEEGVLKQSSRTMSQPASTAGQAPEEQSHQQDDQTVVRPNDGERDWVKSNMSEAWRREAFT